MSTLARAQASTSARERRRAVISSATADIDVATNSAANACSFAVAPDGGTLIGTGADEGRARSGKSRTGRSLAARRHPGGRRPVDLVLLDGAKVLYPRILALLEPRLAEGALVVADNADHSPDYLARVRSSQKFLSVPFGQDVELSQWLG